MSWSDLPMQEVEKDLESLEFLRVALQNSMDAAEATKLKRLASKKLESLRYYEGKLHECVSGQQDIGFVFVESDLVRALRLGDWILLDNVNSAPPEQIERLNSLLEENPVINIYEHADGMVLSRLRNLRGRVASRGSNLMVLFEFLLNSISIHSSFS